MYSIRGGPFTFADDNFISNSAGRGAVYLSHCWSSTTVTDTLFVNNVAAHWCGALFLDHNCLPLAVINSHFNNFWSLINCSKSKGWWGYVRIEQFCITRCCNRFVRSTFTNNIAKLEGGAVSMRGQYHNLASASSSTTRPFKKEGPAGCSTFWCPFWKCLYYGEWIQLQHSPLLCNY